MSNPSVVTQPVSGSGPKATVVPFCSPLISEHVCTIIDEVGDAENFRALKEVNAPKVEGPVLAEVPCRHCRLQWVPLPFTCVPSSGRSSLTHHSCCWLISGQPSPTPSDQPNTTSAESQTLEPGEEWSYWAHRQFSETKQVVYWCDGKGKWVFMVPGRFPSFRQHFSFLTQCLKFHH